LPAERVVHTVSASGGVLTAYPAVMFFIVQRFAQSAARAVVWVPLEDQCDCDKEDQPNSDWNRR
jgi:hypothetical protein